MPYHTGDRLHVRDDRRGEAIISEVKKGHIESLSLATVRVRETFENAARVGNGRTIWNASNVKRVSSTTSSPGSSSTSSTSGIPSSSLTPRAQFPQHPLYRKAERQGRSTESEYYTPFFARFRAAFFRTYVPSPRSFPHRSNILSSTYARCTLASRYTSDCVPSLYVFRLSCAMSSTSPL